MKTTRTILTVLTSAVLLALVPAASASVTIGPEDPNPEPPTTPAFNWPAGAVIFNASSPAGVVLSAPFDGVVTSWLIFTHTTDAGSTMQLRTLKPLGKAEFRITGGGPVEVQPARNPTGAEFHNVRIEYPVRLPIKKGEIVGVTLTREPMGYLYPVLRIEEGTGWNVGCLQGGCPATDESGLGKAAYNSIYSLAMNAKVEPDVDGDGLGDETQDPCVGVCAPAVPIPTVESPVKKKCKKGKKLKRGKCVKKHRSKHKNAPKK